jgi:hypothetical protein
MTDQTARLLELKGELADEFGLPETQTIVGQAARALLRIEALTVRLCATELPTDDYVTTSRELSAIEAQLVELRERVPPPQEALKVVYFERAVCPKCGDEQERPAKPLERSEPNAPLTVFTGEVTPPGCRSASESRFRKS